MVQELGAQPWGRGEQTPSLLPLLASPCSFLSHLNTLKAGVGMLNA